MNSIITNNSQKILNLVYVLMLLAFIYVFFSYVLPFFLPFFVGLLVASLNVPFINIMERNFRVRRKYAVWVSMILTITLLAIIVIFGAINIYNELVKLQNNLSYYVDNTMTNVQNYYEKALNYYKTLPPDVADAVTDYLKTFKTKSKDVIDAVINGMIGTVQSIPRMLVFTVVALLSAFFFSSDSRRIKVFLFKQMPKNIEKNMGDLKTEALRAFIGYCKAVFILMGVTCVEVSLGLLIMRVDYAILMGLLVGVSEAIPLFGTGIIMVPWILWNLMIGNMGMVIGLSIIFVLGIVLRQLLEPKIIGSTLGLHPLATLLAMYIGIEVFGFAGLFIGPFSLIVLKSVQKAGLIKIWNE